MKKTPEEISKLLQSFLSTGNDVKPGGKVKSGAQFNPDATQ
jgi:hypothetical protein